MARRRGCHATGTARPTAACKRIAAVSTKDIILTLGVMLVAGLVCQLVADSLRAPAHARSCSAGTLLGPSVTDVIDVPLDSTGAELLLTLGVSFILFYGGLQLSVGVLSRVAVGLGLLAVPGVVVTALVTGTVASLAFDVPFSIGSPDRRGARAHRPGDPDSALRRASGSARRSSRRPSPSRL